jgi:hypothetical protein
MIQQPKFPISPDLTQQVVRSSHAEAPHSLWLAHLAYRLGNRSPRTRRTQHSALAACMAVGVLLLTLAWAQPAYAGTITVDGDGTNGTCSLADAIDTAWSGSPTGNCTGGSSGADTIDLTVNVTLTSSLPAIYGVLTIEGNGHTIQRSSASSFHILYVHYLGNLTLKDTTITGGSGTYGGGIANDGTLLVQECTISSNSAINGGGISNELGIVTVEKSVISGNTASGYGGGMYSVSPGTVTVDNSTISGNLSNNGGGIYNTGLLTVTNSTIYTNTATGSGGGLWNSATANIGNSIVALQASGADCYNDTGGSIISLSYNIESSTSCAFTGAGIQQNVGSSSLKLGALADNGGPTWTHALGSGSVAIDKISNGVNGCVFGVSTDQRGAVRADGSGRGGTKCDIGAYEADSNETPTVVKLHSLTTASGSPLVALVALVAAVIALGAGWVACRKVKVR